ncbi:MAG: AmmeMemoRadiSam system protein A [Gemmatimonadota bacterium]|nr:MAG: AmmeMemoRadiSam system protein A [Gemmatimonadota bacterium]
MSQDVSTGRAEAGPAPELSGEDKQNLLRLARQTLDEYLGIGKLPEIHTDSPALLERRAAFVTLWSRGSGELRGCRGEAYPRVSLIESVVQMAIAAATDDPRFPPVTAEEVPHLRIEINALTPMEPIRPDEVVVGRHGLRIVCGGATGLLLPEVPVRYGWDRAEFLRWVCKKAGLAPDAWQGEDVQLYCFESEAWGEEE